jgi:hypothetical protein
MPTVQANILVARLGEAISKGNLTLSEGELFTVLFQEDPKIREVSRCRTLIESKGNEVAVEFDGEKYFGYKWSDMVLLTEDYNFLVAETGQVPVFFSGRSSEGDLTGEERTFDLVDLLTKLHRLGSSLVSDRQTHDYSVHSLNLFPHYSTPIMGVGEDDRLVIRFGNQFFSQGEDGIFKEIPKPAIWQPCSK